MSEKNQEPLGASEIGHWVDLLQGRSIPGDYVAVAHPFQNVDIFLTPVGWFSRFVWRFIRLRMDWEKSPARVYREVPSHAS